VRGDLLSCVLVYTKAVDFALARLSCSLCNRALSVSSQSRPPLRPRNATITRTLQLSRKSYRRGAVRGGEGGQVQRQSRASARR